MTPFSERHWVKWNPWKIDKVKNTINGAHLKFARKHLNNF